MEKDTLDSWQEDFLKGCSYKSEHAISFLYMMIEDNFGDEIKNR